MIVITVLLSFDSHRLSTKRNHIAGCDNHKFSLVHRPLPWEKGEWCGTHLCISFLPRIWVYYIIKIIQYTVN